MTTDNNQVLKISTSGSVDDGKSTLIGRLLYETHSLTEDKLQAIKEKSQLKGYDYMDFSLATDGLISEREQGITIDVAHIYFSTSKRSYIIADTPGHIEYTRNMITGTSTSQVSIILIDARHGVIEQTKRHFYINNMMHSKAIIVAVNKMDLVEYSQDRFNEIVNEINELRNNASFKNQDFSFIPLSALKGDNVSKKSENMPWYKGEDLLSTLENMATNDLQHSGAARLQIQTIIRPKTEKFRDYRAYAGKLKGGSLYVGEEVMVLPSERKTKIKSISFYNEEYEGATDGSSISLTLADDVNVSRGDIIVKLNEQPSKTKQLEAQICWMDAAPLQVGEIYLLQQGIRQTKVKITSVANKLDISAQVYLDKIDTLEMNDLGTVTLQFPQLFSYDKFENNEANGSFILIDKNSNTTAGVGFF